MSAAGCNATYSKIEAVNPGMRVIAGPYATEYQFSNWREERRQCQAAYDEQRNAGIEVKVVKWKGKAYVLRTIRGWREDTDVKRASFADVGGVPA